MAGDSPVLAVRDGVAPIVAQGGRNYCLAAFTAFVCRPRDPNSSWFPIFSPWTHIQVCFLCFRFSQTKHICPRIGLAAFYTACFARRLNPKNRFWLPLFPTKPHTCPRVFTRGTDHVSPLHDLDRSRQICSRSCVYDSARVSEWDPDLPQYR